MNNCRAIMFILALTLSWTLAGDAGSVTMNKCMHSNGQIEFTDRPCPVDAPSLSIENKTPSQPAKHKSQQIKSEIKAGLSSSGISAENRLKSCEPSIAIAAAKEIVSNPASLEDPMQLFLPAAVFFRYGRKDDGVFWFYAAQLRVRQQMVLVKGDFGQLLSIILMTMGQDINNYAFQNTANFNQILDRVLEWDKLTTNPFREEGRSKKLDKQIDEIYAGFGDLKTKLATEKTSLEAAARKATSGIEQMYAMKKSPICRAGQVDPANVAKETAREKTLVGEYVKSNPEIIRDAGEIKSTWVEYGSTKSTDTMPFRYEVGVISIAGKESHAIVDVTRANGEVKFSLVCIARLRWVSRDVHKDPCRQ